MGMPSEIASPVMELADNSTPNACDEQFIRKKRSKDRL